MNDPKPPRFYGNRPEWEHNFMFSRIVDTGEIDAVKLCDLLNSKFSNSNSGEGGTYAPS
jgi:hypothetical protein